MPVSNYCDNDTQLISDIAAVLGGIDYNPRHVPVILLDVVILPKSVWVDELQRDSKLYIARSWAKGCNGAWVQGVRQ